MLRLALSEGARCVRSIRPVVALLDTALPFSVSRQQTPAAPRYGSSPLFTTRCDTNVMFLGLRLSCKGSVVLTCPVWLRHVRLVQKAAFSSRQSVPPPPPGSGAAGGGKPQPPGPQGTVPSSTGAVVPPEEVIIEATEANFNDILRNCPVPVIIDCYAE
jgi:hypothetical protein